jgi:hypothetical protein
MEVLIKIKIKAKRPSPMDEEVKCGMECYLPIKSNLLIHTMSWMNLNNIMLNQRS